MRERDHSNAIEVLDEGEALTELTVVEEVIHATDSRSKFVLFNFAFKHLRKVVYEESTRTFIVFVLFFVDLLTILEILDGVRHFYIVTDCI